MRFVVFLIFALAVACGPRTSSSSAQISATDMTVDASDDTSSDLLPPDVTSDVTSPDARDVAPDAVEADVLDAEEDQESPPDVLTDPAVETEPVFRCEGLAPTPFRDDLALGAGWVASRLDACTRTVHPIVIPRGARWELSARLLPADARLFMYPSSFGRSESAGDPPPPPIARSDFATEDGELEIEVVAEFSGEHFLTVERDVLEYEGGVELRALCRAGCELEASRYPIVLVHGYAGVDTYFGLIDYFFDVHDRLEALGYDVHTPVTDPIATSERRGRQLEESIDVIVAETGASQVNVIAHSQGGLDARFLTSPGGLGRADVVASITTVSTPHQGVDAVLWDLFSVEDFSREAMAEFNRINVDAADVRYWSWTARSCGTLGFGCQGESAGEVIDPFLVTTYNLLSRFGDNDGIVTTASAVWGDHLGLLFADHFDQVGQIADPEFAGDPFNHRAFYVSEARRLAAAGL
jgi:triacylglycerol lipase